MVPLQHRSPEPSALTTFNAAHPAASVADFDRQNFNAIKPGIKVALNEDQGGLCAYCECALAPTQGHVDHIKPKAGPVARPDLCFSYTNYAHSCSTDRRCGHQKKARLLPIEPGPGCNDRWSMSPSDGRLAVRNGLQRLQRVPVNETIGMLGLNQPALVADRKDWLDRAAQLLAQDAAALTLFIAAAPYRHVLADLLSA